MIPLLLAAAVQVFGAPGPGADDELQRILAGAGAALEAGDLDTAESGFRRAAERAPRHPLPRLGLCEVEMRRERPVEALEHCRGARALAPEAPLPALRVGQLLAGMGAREEALAAFAEARELAPAEAAAYLLPAMLLRDAGRRGEAVALLERGFEAAPQPELAEELCFLLLSTGEVERARAVAAPALERWPDRGGLTLALGLALAQREESRARAAELLARALAADPPNPGRVRLELGRVLLDLDRDEEALAHLRAAAEALPDEPEAHYRLGLVLRATGDVQGAARALARFQELSGARDAGEWTAKEVLTELKEAQRLALDERFGAALERVDAVLAEHPDQPHALAMRARLLGALGREAEALAPARRARELAPEVAENHYLEGLFLVRSGEIAAGEARLRSALTLDPRIAEAHELLGVLAANDGRLDEAVDHLRRALEQGDDPDLRRTLAQALRAAGRPDEADAVLERRP